MVRLPPRLRPLFPYLKSAYVRATAVVAPVTVRISRTRDGALPTGATTLRAAAQTTGGRYVIARPAETVVRPRMRGIPPGLPLTDPVSGESFAAVGVGELPGGRVLGPHHAVISADGRLVEDVSWYFGTRRARQHPLYLNPFPPPPHRVRGRLAVLAARGDSNYYHFLMDVVTKLGVLELVPEIEGADYWYAPQDTAFARELLDLAGVPRERRVDAAQHAHVQADTLVVPAPPAMTEKNPPWAVQWLRQRLLPQIEGADGPGPRLYITRGPSAHNRSVINEDEVTALLDEYGFVALDPSTLSVADQIRAFSRAPLIVAPHGAALANLIFASRGAAVIELFPAGCLLPDFWRLACGVPGLHYRYLSAPGRTPRRGRPAAIVRDIHVDVDALRRLINELS